MQMPGLLKLIPFPFSLLLLEKVPKADEVRGNEGEVI